MVRAKKASSVRAFCTALLGSVQAFPAVAQEPINGRALVEEHCAICHAIDTSGTSPNRLAPPFRRLSELYSLDDLQQRLETGTLFPAHPQMPNFRVSRGAARAITIYLRSIQD
jgi:mono/diheme cytochrome c family protein